MPVSSTSQPPDDDFYRHDQQIPSYHTYIIPISVSIGIDHPAAHSIKAVDTSSGCGYWLERRWNCLTKTIKSVHTILANIVFGCTPETLDEIELTVELWIESYMVACKFNLFLERALLLFCECRSAVAQHSPLIIKIWIMCFWANQTEFEAVRRALSP